MSREVQVRFCEGLAVKFRRSTLLVATAPTREQIEAIVPTIEKWLKERGLVMHTEKTRIVSVQDGFNFLGFTVKHYKDKCLFQPQKEKVLVFLKEIRRWLKRNRSATAENVIRHLNPILIGWSNYYKHASSKETFNYVHNHIWNILWKWCLRRHSNKGKYWVRKKYFQNINNESWRFFSKVSNRHNKLDVLWLYNMSHVRIERHVKICGNASPDDPTLQEYWKTRQQRGKGLMRLTAYWDNSDVRTRTI